MPPAISDDEMSDVGGDIVAPAPVKATRGKSQSIDYADDVSDAKSEPKSDAGIPKISGDLNGDADDANGDDDEDDAEDLEADEYVVEKILDHQVGEDGLVNFRVKWEGYSKKSDQTWEPEDSLKEGAAEILEEYLRVIGGREALFEQKSQAKATKKRGRPAASTPPAGKRSRRNGHPADSTPPASATAAKGKAWTLPSGSWEDDVESIDACQDEQTGALVIYLNWANGQKTKHPTEVVYKRCPQKMLRFYEKHIRIVKSEPEADADNNFGNSKAESAAPEAEM